MAVRQTGELFPITVEELDSEARAVNPVEVLAREGQVGGEVNLAHLGLLVGIVIDHDDCADGTHEADGIDLGEVQRHDGIAVLDGCLLEHVLSRVLDVNVAVDQTVTLEECFKGCGLEVKDGMGVDIYEWLTLIGDVKDAYFILGLKQR